MGLHGRSVSESSDDIDIFPLEIGDIKLRSVENVEFAHKIPNEPTNRFFSSVMGIKRKKGSCLQHRESELAKQLWIRAVRKARAIGDPWEKFHLDEYATEKAKRHRFHSLNKRWIEDEVVIKMEREPFNNGAMRECFRMKKLSNFAKRDDWSRAHNYVAKQYMKEDTPRNTYFEDVKLQMDAKLWGEEFNRHNPPKKVDIFQMAILEMFERPGSPLFHVEHFIEGKYIKYNSNSGFVQSDALRMTPQAFSHFTFERSGHELIVVDIQGVGDLYTDPQIHTCSGAEYGDGNLGTRGMALFFHSHICNSICESLGLTQFDLSSSEIDCCRKISDAQKFCKTVVRGTEEHVVVPSPDGKENILDSLRLRSISSGYMSNDERDHIDSVGSLESMGSADSIDDLHLSSENEDSAIDLAKRRLYPRVRYDSINDFGESTETKENNLKTFNDMVQRKARPSHVYGELEHQRILEKLFDEDDNGSEAEQFILGQIHLDLAKYHELSRFVEENETYDRKAALFHLKYAAKCGNLDAILAMAQIHLRLPHDVLPDIELSEEECDPKSGFEYLLSAAKAGDRAAIVRVATAFDSGIGLPSHLSINWAEAVFWYEFAVKTTNDDSDGNYDGTMNDPIYQLIAHQAHLYWKGGNQLAKDTNKAGELFTYAADLATEAMKGKMASKYYMLAEEAWAETDED